MKIIVSFLLGAGVGICGTGLLGAITGNRALIALLSFYGGVIVSFFTFVLMAQAAKDE